MSPTNASRWRVRRTRLPKVQNGLQLPATLHRSSRSNESRGALQFGLALAEPSGQLPVYTGMEMGAARTSWMSRWSCRLRAVIDARRSGGANLGLTSLLLRHSSLEWPKKAKDTEVRC